jgi:shikimate kinase
VAQTAGAPSHIILVGLPGSGKTTVGRALADRLGRPFLDFDEEIERRDGEPVARIFASKGEPYFRALELALTKEMQASRGQMVLAPGGGWVTIPGALETLRPPSSVIYLAVRPETAIHRMGALHARRPLLSTADPLGALALLLARRGGLYEAAADLVVDTEKLDVQRVTDQIADWISLFRGNPVKGGG